MPSFTTLLTLTALPALVFGHGDLSEHEAREHKRSSLDARSALEAQCGDVLAAHKARHLARREESVLTRRSELGIKGRDVQSTGGHGTCILTPEVTQGPYHILGDIVRPDIAESQKGIPLEVHATFLDIKTCKPAQVWVDSWHANATGYYSGYVGITGPNTSPGQQAPPPNNTKALTPTSGVDPPFVAAFLDVQPTDNSTFLRGVWPTDKNGNLVMKSVFPGWYEGRAQHYHIKVYEGGYVATNGTYVAGKLHHTGQFFFDPKTLAAVARTYPYNTNNIPWSDTVPNEEDAWYPYADSSGYTADMAISYVNPKNINAGLVGSIVVGVNMSFISPELSTYWSETDAWDLFPKPPSNTPSTDPSTDAASSDDSSN